MPPIDPSKLRNAGAQLHQIWTERLYREYDNILFQYRVTLRRPVIQLEPLPGRWGTWDPLTRHLTLSSRLLDAHPWNAVLEILKHEMAHQLVTDVFGADHTHSAHFAHACKVLRVADWAARATGDIPDTVSQWKDRVLTAEEEKLLRRVEKLLSLAASSNEHEALLAMQRVQELYTRYNLDRLHDRRSSTMVSLTMPLRKKRIDRLDSMLCSILQEHFMVRIIYGRLFDARDLCEYRTADLLGTRENVLMAEYVYHFLWQKLRSLWEEYQTRTGTPGRARQDYMLGVLSGFRKKLEQGKAEVLKTASSHRTTGETTALVKLGQKELEAFVEQQFPRLKTRRWSATYRDADSYAAGVEEGHRIVLQRGIAGKNGNRGHLIEG